MLKKKRKVDNNNDNNQKEIFFRQVPISEDYRDYVIAVVEFLLFFFLAFYLKLMFKYAIICTLVLLFVGRINFYNGIEGITNLEIYKSNGKFVLRLFGMKIPLNIGRCYLEVEPSRMKILSPIASMDYSVFLVRNESKLLYRIFKNRITLYQSSDRDNCFTILNRIKNDCGFMDVMEYRQKTYLADNTE